MPKYLGTLNEKKQPPLDKSLTIMERLHQTVLSFQGIRFYSMFKSNHTKVFRKLIEESPWLSQFRRTEIN